MKYFIVGLHSSGKQEVIDVLRSYNISCGNLFTNLENPNEEVYNHNRYDYYPRGDVNMVFENDAYLFIQELNPHKYSDETYYEGLSKYTFDQNDVFVISPDQLININQNSIKEPVCFVWMDSTKSQRISRYKEEKRRYNFLERDGIEKKDIDSFVKTLYSFKDSNIIYFYNEQPQRVAVIIETLIKHPDMFDKFVKNFN